MQAAPLRKIWRHHQVVDASGPGYTLRTYLEQTDVRAWLTRINRIMKIRSLADIGAGYGRLTPVLAEFADHVLAFEREPHFVADIARYQPQVDVRQIESLGRLPVRTATLDVALAFTVLQHLDNSEVLDVAAELKRIIVPGGHILLCEATDQSLYYDEETSPEGGVTIGRSVEHYQRLFTPFNLIDTAPRRTEPGYQIPPGTYMLFRKDT